ncbi:NAD(P)H-dependent oxidoreductase [Asticcacaulis sp. DW145]|jgi:chromate reductase|uniref:NAD(P)H-dependent oxidoreductase n=1 Tax=Asticcacaulis currens TaxID=2984210 RepID=A0ABT5IGW6_9CAUL|nr:NADPH-dependent FMN reductase [Asticcacaulis currens]MDC7695143.1 NAD(P)H-dependent oxidoreductase [Asticcacaulis currens]BEV12730.1 NAD(P)H-dependent oxidoreductase [Asticcacaulis sp. DW145]
MSSPKLIALSGSLRKASYTTALLRTLAANAPAGVEIEVAEVADIPVYNQDLDVEPYPEGVARLRAQVQAADGVLVGSPEYNYAMPGSTKNLLDWLSRPYGKAALAGKPALIITTSPASTGGVRAQAQIRGTLAAIGAHPLGGAEVVVPFIDKKTTDGVFTDEGTLSFIEAQVKRLVDEIEVRKK